MAGIFILAMAYIMSHFYRSFLAVLSPLLSTELGLSPAQLGNALGAWFVAFALSQFLVGVMLDKIGPKWTSAGLFAVCAGGGGLLFAMAHSYFAVMAAMILLGIGCAPILMASVYIFKLGFPPHRFAFLMSTFIAVGLAGNILGASPLAFALGQLGWRGVMYALSTITIVLSVLIVLLVQDPERVVSDTEVKGGYLDILRMRELWFLLPLLFINYAVSGGLRGLWAGSYLDLIHGLDTSGIGKITLWMAIAMAVGSLAYGSSEQLFNTRKRTVVVGSIIAFLSVLYWALDPQASVASVTIVLVTVGFFTMCYGLLMAQATANIPNHLAGRAVTLINFFNMGGVGIMSLVTSEVYSQNTNAQNPVEGFSSVLWVYVICFGTALLIYLFSKDVKPRP
ncbi:MAG: MFS transporter [Rhizobiaceae bacterium]